MKKFILPGIILCSFLVSIAFVGYSIIATANAESTLSIQEKMILELEDELNVIEKEKSEKIDVKVVLNSASQAGTAVAAYQSDFSGMTDSARDDLEFRAGEMRSLFASSDSGSTVPWYTNGGNAERYTWNFETTYSFAGKSVPVLWLCRNRQNEVLAYATAVYGVDDSVFSDVKWASVSRGSFRTSNDIDLPDDIDRDDIWKALIEKGKERLAKLETPSPEPDDVSSQESDVSSTPGDDTAVDIGREDLPANLVSQSIEAGYPIPEREPTKTPQPTPESGDGNFSGYGVIGG